MRNLEENLWFKQQQNLLLWMANTDYGRDLLHIDKRLPEIHQIKPDSLKMVMDDGTLLAKYRTAPKWARIIRTRWHSFQEYAQYYYAKNWQFPVMFPVANTVRQMNLGPYYPVAGAAAPLDGYNARSAVDETFATIRGGAGNTAFSVTSESGTIFTQASATTDQFQAMYRTHIVFSTSDISPSTVATATIGLYGKSAQSTGIGTQVSHLCASTIANGATTLADTDYTAVLFTSFGSYSASWSTAAYNVHTLNADGRANINTTTASASKFVRMSNWDQANSFTGTWVSGLSSDMECWTADKAGTANDPELTITTASATKKARTLMLLKVG